MLQRLGRIFALDRPVGDVGVEIVQARKDGISRPIDKRRATVPAARFGTADEFGATCAFLCSVQAGYLNGQNILLDGGTYPGTF